ncbi:hypothetical protein V496_04420 [Pseudogymnoascus sp. VKM F-4515 (FW-2607)]|nr:hypothetical protein V496_04420 [Pseudogymnoascus sp. VKM F-4515 (FW-2607)]KFY78361.1 hypothetical protein V498_09125 [Pseudogymnoascus sp. VKM F-4517 (FW-2822)]
MSLLNRTARCARTLPNLSTPPSRLQCLLRAPAALPPSRHLQRRAITSSPSPSSNEPSTEEHKRLREAAEERRQYYKRRSIYNGIGFVTGMVAIWVIATSVDLPQKPTKLDSKPGYDARLHDPLVVVGTERKAVVQKMGEEAEDNTDTVETGTSTVPTFPRLMQFDDEKTSEKAEGEVATPTEYQLLGLGIRKVSFLSIQVYVVGMYVATDDIAQLQRTLIKKIDPIATTLVAGEKDTLKERLMDPEAGEEVWNHILSSTSVRTLFRIVPVRDTDFGHMRDAYVRAVTSQARKHPKEFGDDKFGQSVAELKAMFGHGNVPKGRELVLARNGKGALAAWFDAGKAGPQRLGEVDDERISRALWLHYLAGSHVASEAARKSIVDGIMEFVERPVGTVAAQVHV